ncbi:MAG: hypothetical protein AAB320_09620 [Elusimicrobiota bacterium]
MWRRKQSQDFTMSVFVKKRSTPASKAVASSDGSCRMPDINITPAVFVAGSARKRAQAARPSSRVQMPVQQDQ